MPTLAKIAGVTWAAVANVNGITVASIAKIDGMDKPASGFDPLTLSPALWLDASDASTLYDATSGGSLVAADGYVKRWEDKSGNGNHATQATDSKRPQRKTSVQNGLDIVLFDATDDGMATALTLNRPYTIVAVFRQMADGGGKRVISASNNCILAPRRTGDFTCYIAGVSIRTAVWGSNAQHGITTLVVDATNPAILRGDGVALSTTGAIGANWGQLYLGSSPFGESANAQIAEVFAFTRVLDSGEITSLESYLASKWGL